MLRSFLKERVACIRLFLWSKKMDYNLIRQSIVAEPWAIEQSGLQGIAQILDDANSGKYDYILGRDIFHKAALNPYPESELTGGYRIRVTGDTAIIPVTGPIFPKANLITNFSGGTSAELLLKDIQTALETPLIKQIILEIDSPGGKITGINETSDFIYQHRNGVKPIIAYITGMGASAAYWIASACTSIVIENTAEAGSIGVIATLVKYDEKDPKSKTYTFISSSSPNKRIDPGSDEGQKQLQEQVDYYGELFVQAVARNRNTTVENVLKNFGKGGVLIGQKAVAAGLADQTGSLYQLINAKKRGTQFMDLQTPQAPSDASTQPPQITTAVGLQSAFPELTAQIAQDAVSAERKRVNELLEISASAEIALDDADLSAAIASGQDVGCFSAALIKSKKVGKKVAANEQDNAMLAAIRADGSPQVRSLPTLPTTNDNKDNEDDEDLKQAIAAAEAQFGSVRKVKGVNC